MIDNQSNIEISSSQTLRPASTHMRAEPATEWVSSVSQYCLKSSVQASEEQSNLRLKLKAFFCCCTTAKDEIGVNADSIGCNESTIEKIPKLSVHTIITPFSYD
ncbi:hypothetical protein D5018_17810 [Parashewanella curva]|uniref:Uncharacterized protein n=1 Tax=Parashewanella curva TaxID=2338552 RepID=A0A3L8PSJ8_9GAMM|nr:hypothetical protein [Parashewanella curva]RLV58336.1 hypothetical protein D5018_17810 [Parashewanella curva]